MPARDTYRIEATIQGEYDDEPVFNWSWKDYLSPGQPDRETMAAVMRSAALELAPEAGESRSEEAILAALDSVRAAALKESVGPATCELILSCLWDLATTLNVEWYGVGRGAVLDETQQPTEEDRT